MRATCLIFLLLFSNGALAKEPTLKQQIIYLAQVKDCKDSLALYRKHKAALGRHDFEVLQEVASILLEQSARSATPEKQILGIFGCSIGGYCAPSNLLEQAIVSSEVQVQLAAIQYLGRMQEDYADILLNKAMASPFLFTRLESAFLLAQRKAKSATGQIESLMYRLPPPMRSFFPEFFALIGTTEAIHILRDLMDDSFHLTRIESILSAARHGRDDLLPSIRAAATHTNGTEQEASAAALGYLRDMKSIKKLKKLANQGSNSVKVAALSSLFMLGDDQAADKIAYMAQSGNVFAIGILARIKGYEGVLARLLKQEDRSLRFNAALSLLQKKDPKSVPALVEFLVRDSKDLGFQPVHSTGGALRAWKVISSCAQKAEDSFYDLKALTLAVKELILDLSLELPEEDFLTLSEKVFASRQPELIPKMVSLLEAKKSPNTLELLKKKALTAGAPLLRTYCNLALYRLKEPGEYGALIKEFIQESRSHELIRFRSNLPTSLRLVETPFTLTPEESSALLIRAYETLAYKEPQIAIDYLIEALELGNPNNRPVLAGILLHTLL